MPAEVMEAWLASSRPAALAGLSLRPVEHAALKRSPLSIQRGQAEAFCLSQPGGGGRWFVKKFHRGREPDRAYLQSISSLLPGDQAFHAGTVRQVLSPASLQKGPGCHYSASLASWLDGTVLMPRVPGNAVNYGGYFGHSDGPSTLYFPRFTADRYLRKAGNAPTAVQTPVSIEKSRPRRASRAPSSSRRWVPRAGRCPQRFARASGTRSRADFRGLQSARATRRLVLGISSRRCVAPPPLSFVAGIAAAPPAPAALPRPAPAPGSPARSCRR
jgi:hypothetical protein